MKTTFKEQWGLYWADTARQLTEAWLDYLSSPSVLSTYIDNLVEEFRCNTIRALIGSDESFSGINNDAVKLLLSMQLGKADNPRDPLSIDIHIPKDDFVNLTKTDWSELLIKFYSDDTRDLLSREIIKAWDLLHKKGKTCVAISVSEDISDLVNWIRKQVSWFVAKWDPIKNKLNYGHGSISDDEWRSILRTCHDRHFLENFKEYAWEWDEKNKLLWLNDDVVLLRFHKHIMESYRESSQWKDNHWWSVDRSCKCSCCDAPISWPQNFARDAWVPMHISCIPEHLSQKKSLKQTDTHREYLQAVHDAMFSGIKN